MRSGQRSETATLTLQAASAGEIMDVGAIFLGPRLCKAYKDTTEKRRALDLTNADKGTSNQAYLSGLQHAEKARARTCGPFRSALVSSSSGC